MLLHLSACSGALHIHGQQDIVLLDFRKVLENNPTLLHTYGCADESVPGPRMRPEPKDSYAIPYIRVGLKKLKQRLTLYYLELAHLK